ncbi:hypothetical protein G6F50_014516 [Rhizopus delemar]|uniref:Uncharacterized protein n=1 Tax=Rhizopus delemar TaxID=936053 RepID=A0A9P7C7Y9_9FUNG|nr:hypothetical protein G6F50_014516 [Rhizopus delemar]
MPAQRAMHLDAQRATRWHVTECGLGVVHVGDQSQATTVEDFTLQGRCHQSRGPVQQAHAQALLQRLDRVGHRGPWQAKILGGAGETAALDDTDEGAHGRKAVHCSAIRMVSADYARLSAVGRCCMPTKVGIYQITARCSSPAGWPPWRMPTKVGIYQGTAHR